ncbi:flavodoxin reductase [bacterium]|nr:flavodoxin reductase [bacterium]
MEEHTVKITTTGSLTHDVRFFRVEKPAGYAFTPGQATDVSVNTPEQKNRKRPFTFTGQNHDPYLEFIIKIYPSHNGVTNEIEKLGPGDELIIRNAWGAISYKGPGVFIAGGAGITPFVSIFRDLRTKNLARGNRLIFANKTKADIILEEEFRELLGPDFINILSEEDHPGYSYGMISEEFLRSVISDFNTNFYLCGPPPMMAAVKKQLTDLGVEKNSFTLEF